MEKKRKKGKIRARPNRLGVASLDQGPAWVQGLGRRRLKKTSEHFKNWNTPSGYRGSTQSHQVPEPYWTPPMQRRINETETGGRGGQVTITSLIRKRKGLLGWSTCNHIGLVSWSREKKSKRKMCSILENKKRAESCATKWRGTNNSPKDQPQVVAVQFYCW